MEKWADFDRAVFFIRLFTHLFDRVENPPHFIHYLYGDPSKSHSLKCTLPFNLDWHERKGYLSLPDWDKPDIDVYLIFQHNIVTQRQFPGFPTAQWGIVQSSRRPIQKDFQVYNSNTNSSSSCRGKCCTCSNYQKTQSNWQDSYVALKHEEKQRAKAELFEGFLL